jgi:hypothetical protein
VPINLVCNTTNWRCLSPARANNATHSIECIMHLANGANLNVQAPCTRDNLHLSRHCIMHAAGAVVYFQVLQRHRLIRNRCHNSLHSRAAVRKGRARGHRTNTPLCARPICWTLLHYTSVYVHTDRFISAFNRAKGCSTCRDIIPTSLSVYCMYYKCAGCLMIRSAILLEICIQLASFGLFCMRI